MSAYTCPECGGSFPIPVKWQGNLCCPWCYNELLRHHNYPEHSLERAHEELMPAVVRTVRKSDGDRPPSLLDKLKGGSRKK